MTSQVPSEEARVDSGTPKFAVVSTTVANADDAAAIARMLVEGRLAACVQIVAVESVYRWNNTIDQASEKLLLCKIVAADFAVVEAAIRQQHHYALPEIIMMPITAGHAPYLAWLDSSVAR